MKDSMPLDLADQALFLFVPADRPERFEKAATAGADAVIIDLEDAVAPEQKAAARQALRHALSGRPLPGAVHVRVNGIGTDWHETDVSAVASSLPVAGIMLPKAESAFGLRAVREHLPPGMQLIALIETARGLAKADEIAEAADRVAFGSVDFAADLGAAHERESLLLARSRIVLAARLAGKPAPIDGVTLAIKDEQAVANDARYGASLGFGGKLLIHPAQIAPARRGLAPRAEDIAWAEKIVASVADGAARAVDGTMVDAPVLARARQILRKREHLQ